MPAQPLDNTKNQQSSVGTDPISTNFASGVSTATADP